MKGGSPSTRDVNFSAPQSTRPAAPSSYSGWERTKRSTTPCTTGRSRGMAPTNQSPSWHVSMW
eukprot:5709014-Prorocentrum_lima.AAC.1